MQPRSHLMATGQIRWNDCISVSHTEGSPFLIFSRETGALEGSDVAERVAA